MPNSPPDGVRAFSFGADGTLTQLPGSPFGSAEVEDLAMTPDGRFLFGSFAGGLSDGVALFSVAPDGNLIPNGEPVLTGDLSLDYFAVAPDGRFIYMPDSNLQGSSPRPSPAMER